MMSILRISDLSFRYKANGIKPLDEISVEVEEGSIFGLVGKNGAGKTTFLQVLMGILKADSGSIQFMGEEFTEKVKSRLGFVSERPYYHEDFRLREYLFFLNKLSRKVYRSSSIDELIDFVHLTEFKKEYLRNFSKGMLQRVGVAQALMNDPELLVLDEPMSGLDILGQTLMRDLILKINQQGTTVIISTHNLYEIERLCKQIGVLHKGKFRLLEEELIQTYKNYAITLTQAEHLNAEEFLQIFSSEGVYMENGKVLCPLSNDEVYFKVMDYLGANRLKIAKLETVGVSLENFIVKYLSEEGEENE